MKRVLLVTGNKNKLAEFQAILKGRVDLDSVALDLPELQGVDIDIAKTKALTAYERVKAPVIV